MKHRIFPLVVFCALFALYLLLSLDSPFASKGEAREGLVVKDMVEQSDLILPLRNGVDIPSKPPLFHWMAVFALQRLHFTPELAIRFPSALTASLAAMLFFAWLSERRGSQQALLATLLLVTSIEWARSAVLARVDMVFTFALFCCFLTLHRFLERRGEWTVGGVLLGGFLALAVLTKGPAGLAIPVAAGVLGWLYFFRTLRNFPYRSAMLTMLIAVVGAGSWYLVAYLQHGQEFLDVHLMRENVARLFGTKGYVVGHRKPFYFATINLLMAFLPWSLFLFVPIAAAWRERRNWRAVTDLSLGFSLIWLIVVLIVFSISTSKRTVYLLPALPTLAVVLAAGLRTLRNDGTELLARWTQWLTLAFGTVLGLAVVSLWYLAMRWPLPSSLGKAPLLVTLDNVLPDHWGALTALSFTALCAILVGWFFHRWKAENAMALLSALGFVVVLAVGATIQPAIAGFNSPFRFMAEVNGFVTDERPLHQYRHDFYPALFYSKRDLGSAIMAGQPVPESGLFLVQHDEWFEFVKEAPDAEVVLVSNGFAVDGEDRLLLASRGTKIQKEDD